jgi:ATP:ADP antiporter, AAA family
MTSKTSTSIFLALAGFAVMVSYGLARPLANALFSTYFEAVDLLWGMAATPVVVTLLLWPYGYALRAWGPRLTLALSTILSIGLLVVPLAFRNPATTFFLYVWKDVYVVLLVEQFWAFANSHYSVERSKKAYGLLLFIGGLGAICGNQLVERLSQPLGSWTVLAGAPLVLIPFVLLMDRAFAAGADGTMSGKSEQASGESLWQLMRRSRYLLGIAAVVGLGQVMAGTLDVVFHEHVYTGISSVDERAAFGGRFWFWVNAGSMVLQVLTPVALRLLAVPLLLLVVPMTHLVAVGALLVHPGLWTAALAFAWFKMVDYSLFRASKEVLYVPLDFDARYRAKMLIDMTVYRVTKGGAGIVLSLARWVAASLTALLPLVAAAAAAAWFLFALKIGRDFAKLRDVEENGTDMPWGKP